MTKPQPVSQDIGSVHWTLGGCGLAIFLVSLSILFLAGLVGLIYLRLAPGFAPGAAPADTEIQHAVPTALWFSTGLLLLVSLALGRAVAAARAARRHPLRFWLLAAAALALAFLANQVPALAILLHRHFQLVADVQRSLYSATQPAFVADPRRYLFGLMFFLILLHALHVLGGLIALGVVMSSALRFRAAPNVYASVRLAAIYWHFLDVVWLILFAGFLFL